MDTWDQFGKGTRESEDVAEVLDEVAKLVLRNPGLQLSEKLLELIDGRLSVDTRIMNVS